MYVSQIYLKEIKWRLLYTVVSFLITLIITFSFMESILLFEIYPFIKASHKKFIATHITELFNSVIFNSLTIAFIVTFPTAAYHTMHFFLNSWYTYQKLIFFWTASLMYVTWTLSFACTYTILLPYAFDFFTQWENRTPSSLLQIGLDIRIQHYLNWTTNMYSFISLMLDIMLLNLLVSISLIKPPRFYIYLKLYKKFIFFITISLAFIVIPQDLFIQFTILIITTIILESIFFLSCFRIIRFKS
uniref:Sec-independent translocase component C n=1 Tax=Balbiania investiens TaxID=111861 RepID=A0A4D6BP60_9FLOR